MLKEIWLPVKGYEENYQISNTGIVKRISRAQGTKVGREVKPHKMNNGYLHIVLCKNGVAKTFLLHRLVAQAFIPNPLNNCQINHIDNNPLNNNISNLEWITQKENMKYSYNQNRQAKGEKHGQSKLKEEDILEIRKSNFTQVKLASIYKISQVQISNIINKKTWKHL